jgi:tRNA threonylcarbamoyl adenosine modification protein YeaZ
VLLLALDTATPAVTVALHDGTSVLAGRTTVDARRHAELLAPSIAGVLADAGRDRAELTDIVVGVGPGPFTGLRVGLVTARTLGDALGLPVHGVCTLDTLAYQAPSAGVSGPFAVATDARRKEIYWARYDGPTSRLTEPEVDWPATVAPLLAGLPVIGDGALGYAQHFDARDPRYPAAEALAELAAHRLAVGGSFLPPAPLYLRRPDAVEPAARKPVLGAASGRA